MYYCSNCKQFTDELADGVVQTIDGRSERQKAFCPHCHSDEDISEVDVCAVCGEPIAPLDEHTLTIDEDDFIVCDICAHNIREGIKYSHEYA